MQNISVYRTSGPQAPQSLPLGPGVMPGEWVGFLPSEFGETIGMNLGGSMSHERNWYLKSQNSILCEFLALYL